VVDLGGGGEPILAGQVDVDDGHLGLAPSRGGQDVVTRRDLGDHLDVRLQIEQRDEGPTHHVHVLSEQHLDDHPFVRLLLLEGYSGYSYSTIPPCAGGSVSRAWWPER